MNQVAEKIKNFKAQFADRTQVALNNAGLAPLPANAAKRAHEVILDCQKRGPQAAEDWIRHISVASQNLGRFLSVHAHELAFTQNCATALSHVAFGFPLTPKDTVITIDQEYASNFYPWQEACKRSGATLKIIESERDLSLVSEKIVSAIKPGVKLVGLSWVQFQSGSQVDLVAIGNRCHEVGAYLVVDAIQGLGQLPFSFAELPIDFVTGASHKWMCSLQGLGFLAIKKELAELVRPAVVGSQTFNRHGQSANFSQPMETSARKFEAGGTPLPQLMVMDEVLKLFQETGMQNISQEISRISRLLRQGILACGGQLVTPLAQPGGITSFKLLPAQEEKLLENCAREKISIAKREKVIRVSPHAFNTDDEIQKFLSVLKGSV